MIIQNILTKLDQIFDCVPILSTFTNAVDIVIRKIFLSNESTKVDLIKNNTYFEHLETKRAIGKTALIPIVGNAVIIYYTFHKYEAKVEAFISALSETIPLTKDEKQQMKQEILDGKLHLGKYKGTEKLVNIPREIGALTRLKEISIKNSKVTTLPEEIGNLINLETLDIVKTPINSLPSSIGNLVNLNKMQLEGTKIKSLPPEIGNLVNLEVMYLSNTPLESLPPEIGGLINLKVMKLAIVPIKSLPSTIGNLVKLEELVLKAIPIESLPPEIGNLVELEELNIEDTPIESLPIEVGKLRNLEFLELINTKIKNFPIQILHLTKLRGLEFSGSPLTYIPREISYLENLQGLSLVRTKITFLPHELALLPNLQKLFIRDPDDRHDSRLIMLPLEFIALSIENIGDLGFPMDKYPPEDWEAFQNIYRLLFMIKEGCTDVEFKEELDKNPYRVLQYYEHPSTEHYFEHFALKNILAQDFWSDKGIKVVQWIDNKDVEGFRREYYEYKSKFDKFGPPDKTVVVEGQEIPYHSAVIPVERMEYLARIGSSKGVKAILYQQYCGDNPKSVMLNYWMDDLIKIKNMEYFRNDFPKIIEQDYGPPDAKIKINGELIPVHREVLKSYCDMFDDNYLSIALSGKFEQSDIIDLDYTGESAFHPVTYGGVALEIHRIYQGVDDGLEGLNEREWEETVQYLIPGKQDESRLRKLREGFQDKGHVQRLFNLHVQHILNNKMSTNPSAVADVLSDLYLASPYANLRHICEEAFAVANMNKIRLVGTVEDLMKLVQQKAYVNLKSSSIVNYSNEDIQMYFNYQVEHLEGGKVDALHPIMQRGFDVLCPVMQNYEPFLLSEKGQAIFRKEAFEYMSRISSPISNPSPTYRKFNQNMFHLIRLLSYVNIEALTPDENAIIIKMVKHLSRNLPMFMLRADEDFALKDQIVKNWAELNKKLGTNIPFEIDMG